MGMRDLALALSDRWTGQVKRKGRENIFEKSVNERNSLEIH